MGSKSISSGGATVKSLTGGSPEFGATTYTFNEIILTSEIFQINYH